MTESQIRTTWQSVPVAVPPMSMFSTTDADYWIIREAAYGPITGAISIRQCRIERVAADLNGKEIQDGQ